jgi:hypothetical protein
VQQTEALEKQALVNEIERLQEKLATLQQGGSATRDTGNMSVPLSKWTIVHEVDCMRTDRTAYYLDEPLLISDRDLGHLHYQGQRQITNMRSWLRKQKTPFIVYRRYHCLHNRESPADPEERVLVKSDELDEVLSTWFRMSSGLSIYDRDGTYTERQLYAPYVCFFHFRHEARHLLFDPSPPVWGAPSLLEYLETAVAKVFQDAESIFATGKVTAELMPYLFKPGSLVCSEQSGDLVACEQASVLKTTDEDSIHYENGYEFRETRIVFDGKFRRLGPSMRYFTVSFEGGQAMTIEDLPFQPVAHISSERRAALEQRGKIFMRCEKQLYVTYPSEGGNHDFVRQPWMDCSLYLTDSCAG